jgi:hypothetical protein
MKLKKAMEPRECQRKVKLRSSSGEGVRIRFHLLRDDVIGAFQVEAMGW